MSGQPHSDLLSLAVAYTYNPPSSTLTAPLTTASPASHHSLPRPPTQPSTQPSSHPGYLPSPASRGDLGGTDRSALPLRRIIVVIIVYIVSCTSFTDHIADLILRSPGPLLSLHPLMIVSTARRLVLLGSILRWVVCPLLIFLQVLAVLSSHTSISPSRLQPVHPIPSISPPRPQPNHRITSRRSHHLHLT